MRVSGLTWMTVGARALSLSIWGSNPQLRSTSSSERSERLNLITDNWSAEVTPSDLIHRVHPEKEDIGMSRPTALEVRLSSIFGGLALVLGIVLLVVFHG